VSWHYPVIFVSGACVLAVEILGSRILSPAFGSGLYVWSSILGVTLAALASGYECGGRIADRGEPTKVLPAALGFAGIWLWAVFVIKAPVLGAFGGFDLRTGTVLACLVLLAPPLAAMGMVTPLVVKIRAKQQSTLGREAGGVAAVSTFGSVSGALAAGLLLIPHLPVSRILLVLGAALICVSAVSYHKGVRQAS